MKRIAVDMDEVIAKCSDKYIKVIKELYPLNEPFHHLAKKKLSEMPAELAQQIISIVDTDGFFSDLEPVEDSKSVILELSKNYEIFIVTAAMEFPTSFADKYRWLKHHFNFIGEANYVFCGDKSIISSDFLIDDNAKHFTRFKGQGLLFSSSHNMEESGYTRVDNWLAVSNYFKDL